MLSGSFKLDFICASLIGALIGVIFPTWATIVIAVIITIAAFLVARSGNGIGAEGVAYVYLAALMVFALVFAAIANLLTHPDFANLLLSFQGRR